MSNRRRKNEEDAVVEEPVSNEAAVAEDAANRPVVNFEDAAGGQAVTLQSEEQQEANENFVEQYATAEDQSAPDDPHSGAGASPENTEELLPSEGDYSGVRDPNYQFQERGKERLVEGNTVQVEESVQSAENSDDASSGE